MSFYNEASYERKLKELYNEYRINGYKVIIEPRGVDLPEFLKGFQPDMIATSDDESVVIEVKTRSNISREKRLDKLADIIQNRPGWRFELAVVKSKRAEVDKNRIREMQFRDIQVRVQEIERLIQMNSLEAAYLLCWSTIESFLRLIAKKEDLISRYNNTASFIKTSFSYGIINKNELEELERSFKVRNAISHGYKQSDHDLKRIRKVLKVFKNIINRFY